jgi:alpha-tubulin suppressor-like RCC1 family protein
MDLRIVDALAAMRDTYGDAVFYNLQTSKNLLNDLAPTLRKERIQVANFLEIGGFFQLKYAGEAYLVVREKLSRQLVETFAVDEAVAEWILNIFGFLLGYDITDDGAIYKAEERAKANASPKISPKLRSVMAVPQAGEIKKVRSNTRFAKRISADYHSVAVTRDGQVKSCGTNSDGQCHTNTYDWRDMTAVSAGACFTIGIRADGTVLGVGRNDFGQTDVKNWTDMTAISAGSRHTVGLRADGTLLACGQNKYGECRVRHWRNIVRVIAGKDCTFGIKKDGRVLVSGNNQNGSLQVSHLENVADIAYAAPGRIIALLQDGTIARVGRENHMRRSFTGWKNVRQLVAAPDYFAALLENGTVHLPAYFWTDSGVEAATTDWREIVAIAAGRHHILGWKSNGTLLTAMLHPDISRDKGQLNVNKWEM